MIPVESFNLKDGKTLKIFPDSDPMDPRDNDNIGTMVFFHRRYTLGDKTDLSPGMFQNWDQMKNYLINKGACVILPVFMLDHSGITIRTYSFNDVDPGCWDSGQIGFIYVNGDKIRNEFSVKRITKKTRDKIRDILISEIREYDSYLTGCCYGYEITDNKTGEILDSCWGFIGDYHETIVPDFIPVTG